MRARNIGAKMPAAPAWLDPRSRNFGKEGKMSGNRNAPEIKVKSFVRRLASWTLVLFLAGVAAENLGAQAPGYFITDYGFNGEFGIGVLNVDGSNVYNVLPNTQAAPPPGFSGGCSLLRTLTPRSPSTSRDGSLIAFESEGVPDRLHRVFVMNPDGTGVRQLTFTDPNFPNAIDSFPVISPDGTRIAFLSARTPLGTRQVFTVNVDGTGLQQITPETCIPGDCTAAYGMAWSPDSAQLAFVGHFPGPPVCPFGGEVHIINADGTGQRFLACTRNGGDAINNNIDWSPDGTRIGFVDAFGLSGRDGLGISQYAPDGRNLGDLTPPQLGRTSGGTGGLIDTAPGVFRYSPDSTRLAYFSFNGPPEGICGGPCPGISFINVDGTGRQDNLINDRNYHHIWWQPGPAILRPTTLTVGPDPLVVGPNFPQQLSPVLKDSAGNILSRSAFGYCTRDGRFALADELGFVRSPFGSGPDTPMVIENGGLVSNVITARVPGIDPPVSFYPATWDFGNQGVGTISATQNFMLTNTGSAVLNINAITLIGDNAADYAFDPSSTCPLGGGGPLMPRDTCTAGVILSPLDLGPRIAQINVDDDATGSPQTIPLMGTGTMAAAAARPRSAPR